jgi:hypothetical protein
VLGGPTVATVEHLRTSRCPGQAKNTRSQPRRRTVETRSPTCKPRNLLGPEAGGWRVVLPSFTAHKQGLGTWRRPFLRQNGRETGARHGKRKDQKRIRKSSTCSRRERVRLTLPARRGAFGQPAEYCGQGTGLRGGFVLQEGGAGMEAKYRTWRPCDVQARRLTSLWPIPGAATRPAG